MTPPPRARAPDARSLTLLHFCLCGVGLPGVVHMFAQMLSGRLFSSHLPLNDWAQYVYFPEKPYVLVFYVMAIAGFFAYSAAVYAVMEVGGGVGDAFFGRLLSSPRNALVYFMAVGVVNLGMLSSPFFAHLKLRALFAFLWSAGLAAPVFISLMRKDLDGWASSRRVRLFQGFCLVAVLSVFMCSFVPFLKGPLKMIDEFMDVPESTDMGGALVDNTEYINRHKIAGLVKYRPDADGGKSPPPPEGLSIAFPKTEELAGFISTREFTYDYDDARGALSLNGRGMSPEELRELSDIAPSPDVKRQVYGLYYRSALWNRAMVERRYSPEETKFIDRNHLELNWQILNRWVIHHHNFILGPINDYALGRPLKEINFQYGVLNVIVTKWLMEKMGGINYQNYFRAWYSYWPLYYAIFFLVAGLILQDLSFFLLTAVLSVSAVNLIGHQFLFLGPGLNPIRHFFDMPALFMIHSFIRGKRRFHLLGAVLFSWLSIVNNKEFGIFIFIAMAVTLSFWWMEERKASAADLLLMAVGVLGVFPALKLARMGSDVHGGYYLRGILGFPLSNFFLMAIIFLFGAAFLSLVWFTRVKSGLRYALVFLLIYVSEGLFYYVWGSTRYHFLNVGPLTVLCLVVFLKYLTEVSGWRRGVRGAAALLAFAGLAGVYLPSLASFYLDKAEYEGVFKTHKTYEWKLDRARFTSTMDPAYFEGSTGLLRKYVPGAGVYIISKYDSFLPFLAGKYSAMPFFDVSYFLFTRKEVDACVEAVERGAPEFLFVDTDIDRNLNGEIVPEGEPIFAAYARESQMRVLRLRELKKLFDRVRADYRPVEKGRLITVYRRASAVSGPLPPRAGAPFSPPERRGAPLENW